MRLLPFVFVALSVVSSNVLWQGDFGSVDSVAIYPAAGGYYRFVVGGAQTLGRSGEPQIPFLTRVVKLAGGYSIEDVSADFRWSSPRSLPQGVTIAPAPVLHPISSGKGPDYIPSELIYGRDSFFPPQEPRWHCGFGCGTTYVTIHIPAVRYNPVAGEYCVLKGALVRVLGRRSISCGVSRKHALSFDEENLILTVESLRVAAESLASLHEVWGVPSTVITAEEIDTIYTPAEYPPLWGFPEAVPSSFHIYADTILALKIISFLRDSAAHPNLRSVTILGKSTHIPPSFYFRDSTDVIWGGDEFNAFVPTDFFYASPDYDWVCDYAVGRLPVYDEPTAFCVVDKLRRWWAAATPELFSRVLLAGGNPFGYLFDDEHTVQLICRDGYVAQSYLTKLYASRGEFTSSRFDEEFRQPYGVVYISGHGSGNTVAFDDGTYWSYADAEALPCRDFSPALMMGSCLNGIYDGDIVERGDPEFPEVLIRSDGGPIAFWGCSRTAYGAPSYHFDGPELVIDEPSLMSRFNYDLFMALGVDAPESFGEWHMSTQRWYATTADMTYWVDQRTLLEYNFFGDPALPLPDYTGAGLPDEVGLELREPDTYDIGWDTYAVYLCGGDSLRASSSFEQTAYLVPLVCWAPRTSHLISRDLAPGDQLAFLLEGGGRFYCLTVDSPRGTERRYYFFASDGILCADGYLSDWCHADIGYAASDGSDFDEDWLDLQTLYVADDPSYLYVAFTTGDPYDPYDWLSIYRLRLFTVALDFRPGGYEGVVGVDHDPLGTYVCFPDSDAPDLVVALRWSIEIFSLKAYTWAETHWTPVSNPWGAGFGCGYETDWDVYRNLCEFAIPRSYLGGADSVDIIVYSALADTATPALDCIPSDPASYTHIVVGAAYANRLTNFLRYRFATESVSEGRFVKPFVAPEVLVHPNPFNEACNIMVDGAFGDEVSIRILDVSGRVVFDGKLSSGHGFVWRPGDDLSSGVYFVRAAVGGSVATKTVLLVR